MFRSRNLNRGDSSGAPDYLSSVAAVAAATFATGLGVWLDRNTSDGQRIILVQPFATSAGDVQARALGNVASDLSRMIVGNDHGLTIVDPGDNAASGKRADFVVSGDAQTSGGDIHASIRLLDRANGSILWSRSFSRPADEVDELRDQIASHRISVMSPSAPSAEKTPALPTWASRP